MPDDPNDQHDDQDPYGGAFNNDDYPVPRNNQDDQSTDDLGYELSEPTPNPPINSRAGQPPSSASPPLAKQAYPGEPQFVQVPCRACGYNLTGIAIGGNCPECGTSVDASLFAAGSAPVNGFAVTSMVLGIVSCLGSCCCPAGLIGIIGLSFGIVAMAQINKDTYSNGSKGMAIAGIICSSIAFVLSTIWLIFMIFA